MTRWLVLVVGLLVGTAAAQTCTLTGTRGAGIDIGPGGDLVSVGAVGATQAATNGFIASYTSSGTLGFCSTIVDAGDDEENSLTAVAYDGTNLVACGSTKDTTANDTVGVEDAVVVHSTAAGVTTTTRWGIAGQEVRCSSIVAGDGGDFYVGLNARIGATPQASYVGRVTCAGTTCSIVETVDSVYLDQELIVAFDATPPGIIHTIGLDASIGIPSAQEHGIGAGFPAANQQTLSATSRIPIGLHTAGGAAYGIFAGAGNGGAVYRVEDGANDPLVITPSDLSKTFRSICGPRGIAAGDVSLFAVGDDLGGAVPFVQVVDYTGAVLTQGSSYDGAAPAGTTGAAILADCVVVADGTMYGTGTTNNGANLLVAAVNTCPTPDWGTPDGACARLFGETCDVTCDSNGATVASTCMGTTWEPSGCPGGSSSGGADTIESGGSSAGIIIILILLFIIIIAGIVLGSVWYFKKADAREAANAMGAPRGPPKASAPKASSKSAPLDSVDWAAISAAPAGERSTLVQSMLADSFTTKIDDGCDTDIWVAKHEGVVVILKTMKEGTVNQSKVRDEFYRENRALVDLAAHGHPHIIRSLFTAPGPPITLALEYATQGHLQSYVEKNKVSVAEKTRIVGEVAQAMELIHAELIAHLDLKTINVLIMADGRAVVADFGICERVDSNGVTSSDLPISFTASYCAPERYVNGASDGPINLFKADVYSYGMVVWAVCAEEEPWATVPNPELMIQLQEDLADRPELPSKGLDATLRWVILHSWAVRPDDRPAFSDLVARLNGDGADDGSV